jgi:hypothetical protein
MYNCFIDKHLVTSKLATYALTKEGREKSLPFFLWAVLGGSVNIKVIDVYQISNTTFNSPYLCDKSLLIKEGN